MTEEMELVPMLKGTAIMVAGLVVAGVILYYTLRALELRG